MASVDSNLHICVHEGVVIAQSDYVFIEPNLGVNVRILLYTQLIASP